MEKLFPLKTRKEKEEEWVEEVGIKSLLSASVVGCSLIFP